MAKVAKARATAPPTTRVSRARGAKVENAKSPTKKPAAAKVKQTVKAAAEEVVAKTKPTKPVTASKAKASTKVDKTSSKVTKKKKKAAVKTITKPSKKDAAAPKVKPAKKAALTSKAKDDTKDDTIAAKVTKSVKEAVAVTKAAPKKLADATANNKRDGDAPFVKNPEEPHSPTETEEAPKLNKFEQRMAARTERRLAAAAKESVKNGKRFDAENWGRYQRFMEQSKVDEHDRAWIGEYNPTLQALKDQFAEAAAGTYQAVKSVVTGKSREGSPVKKSPAKANRAV